MCIIQSSSLFQHAIRNTQYAIRKESLMTTLADLDTPALLVDLPRLRRNIAAMQAQANAAGVALRPHTKTHKSPMIARMQLAAGARGITVAKVGEAEVMVEAG